MYLCKALTAKVPGHTFFSLYGGGASNDATEVEPPFTVINANTVEKTMSQHGVWSVSGAVQVITHFQETTPRQHSEISKVIYDALISLQPEADDDITFHGLDVMAQRSRESDGHKIRVDAIDFTAGVSG